MKKLGFLLLPLLLLLYVPAVFGAEELPYRYATEVNDVTKPYSADEWIISPDDEPVGDQEVSNAPECDIQGVIACYDKEYLRIDILLSNPISYDFVVWYAVKFEYQDMSEYYTYYPLTKTLIYEKEVDGVVVDTQELSKVETQDWAGVTGSSQDNADVYIIINKDSHMSGDIGKKYFLTTYVMAGYIDNQDKMQLADETIRVDMAFER